MKLLIAALILTLPAALVAGDAAAALALAKAARERTTECYCKACGCVRCDCLLADKSKPSAPTAKTVDQRYAAVFAAVRAGTPAVIAVGVPLPSGTVGESLPAGFGGLASGVYDCLAVNGVPTLFLRQAAAAAPQAPAYTPTQTFTQPTTRTLTVDPATGCLKDQFGNTVSCPLRKK